MKEGEKGGEGRQENDEWLDRKVREGKGKEEGKMNKSVRNEESKGKEGRRERGNEK